VLGFFCANRLPLSAHLARSGDADSLYLMFFTFAMLAMFRIREKRKNLYFCGLMFSLAFLTKSWHAGMIVVIGGLYLLISGELFRLKLKEWGAFLLSVFAPLVLWFGWRFTKDGFTFLQQMIQVFAGCMHKVPLIIRMAGLTGDAEQMILTICSDDAMIIHIIPILFRTK